MTPTTTSAPVGTATRLRRLGLVTVVTSLFGVACAFAIIFWPPQVGDDVYSYPFDRSTYIGSQIIFAAQHVGVFAGLYGVVLLAWRGGSRLTKIGLILSIVGTLVLTGCELYAITAADELVGSPQADSVDNSYGVPTLLMGLGLVLAGIGLARQRVLAGWGRWITLALGVYLFVPLFPAIFGPLILGRLAIAGWLLLFAALGFAVMRARP